MDKVYNYLINCYRFIIVGIVIMNLYYVKTSLGDKEMIVLYTTAIFYGVVLALVPPKKIFAAIEMVTVYVLYYLIGDVYLYFLLVVPIVQFLNNRLKKLDIIWFTLLFAFLQYLTSPQLLVVIMSSIALFIGISVVYVKMRETSSVRGHVRNQEKEIHEMKMELTDKTRELSMISKMFVKSKELNEIIDENELITHLVSSAGNFFNAYYTVLYLKNGSEFEIVEEDGSSGGRYEAPETLSAHDLVEPAEITSDMIRVPIKSGNATWGVITIYGKRASFGSQGQMVVFPFQVDDYEILSVYLEQVKFVMKHAKLLKKMSDLANNDFLTKIPNRRYFMSQMSYLIERAKRGETLSIMMLDIDHFKQFNDTFGHDVGDEVLKVVANTIKQSIRKIDILGRLGGEEFAVLLPNTKGNELEVAERVREKIKEIEFRRKITVSIGVANFGIHGETIDGLLKNADTALYRAKETGRDRVVVYGDWENYSKE